MTNVNEILRDHITLSIDCMDRIYLNGYIPSLQVPGQLVTFLTKHRSHKIPSPALLGQIGDQFTKAVKDYAQENGIPILHFEPGQRKDEVATSYRQKFTQAEGVVFIGVGQEKAKSFKALKHGLGFDKSRCIQRIGIFCVLHISESRFRKYVSVRVFPVPVLPHMAIWHG